ncbi:CBS domain-containing protein [Flavobacterium supellecticarium]|uniref:CBS domain-containing protein n=1 Tax=Flavobacterium supellecticarium TaxID=2565924 RepID=A0A4S4A0X1_9FLAO|nr:CBS domain-containing protein [Flavobacterium supellecticarium]THF51822.1 CBS domain-containing protein [Flavobacterium supellecticarium]
MYSEKLKEIKEKLDKGEKVESISVRNFLYWFWGSQRRGWGVVSAIRYNLKINGLETYPDFNSVYIDSLIEFRKVVPAKNEKNKDENQPENIAEKSTDDVLNFDDPTYRISRLEAANKELIFVKPDSELSEAITLMMTHDYSQLPVMQQPNRGLKGVISWRSIGQKLSVKNSSSIVRELMEPNFQLISEETSLFKALPIIIEHDYILVKNKADEICGIVTASDLSLQFKQLTEPFLLVAEIENHVRQILVTVNKEELEKGKDSKDENRKIESVADLTFGEYQRICEVPEIWEKLKLSIDRKIFCFELDKIRVIRNNIMHFDPDGLEAKSTETLRNFVRLLQTLRNLKVF